VPSYLVTIFFNLKKAVIMKKLLLFMSAIALTATIAVAQEKKDYKQERTEWEKKVKNELKLTADQTTKYDALNTEYNGKMDALAQDASLSMDAQKEKKMALKKEKEGKLFEFLTPEQQEKYKALVEQKMKDMKKPSNQ
jgi:Spy/CpxP family protein refolding chaperone